jgi:flagellar biosynthesis protein FlhB
MADSDRTEKPTAKHRKRARDKGQVARSPDLGGSLVLVAGLLTISITGQRTAQAGAASFREILAEAGHPERALSGSGLSELGHAALSTLATGFVPVAAACLITGLLAGFAQVGFAATTHSLKPDFRRINPISGTKNLLGPNLIFETLKAVAKIGAVGAVAALALIPELKVLSSKVGVTPGTLALIFGGEALAVAQHAAFAYVLIGLLDYGWKRYQHEKKLKMTKQEVKDESRQYGVSAEVRAAQRRLRMQAARMRMMAAIPDADVVVANPTHYAVALRYDGTRTAPEVVAKGKDLIAAQIRRIAEENDVPVITDPPLARALHASVEIGQVVPEELYAAVARVLAFVYRMAGKTSIGARRLAS